jgi:hypothetical protein
MAKKNFETSPLSFETGLGSKKALRVFEKAATRMTENNASATR